MLRLARGAPEQTRALQAAVSGSIGWACRSSVCLRHDVPRRNACPRTDGRDSTPKKSSWPTPSHGTMRARTSPRSSARPSRAVTLGLLSPIHTANLLGDSERDDQATRTETTQYAATADALGLEQTHRRARRVPPGSKASPWVGPFAASHASHVLCCGCIRAVSSTHPRPAAARAHDYVPAMRIAGQASSDPTRQGDHRVSRVRPHSGEGRQSVRRKVGVPTRYRSVGSCRRQPACGSKESVAAQGHASRYLVLVRLLKRVSQVRILPGAPTFLYDFA